MTSLVGQPKASQWSMRRATSCASTLLWDNIAKTELLSAAMTNTSMPNAILSKIYSKKTKEFKMISMRSDKTDQSFKALIYLAAAVIKSRRIQTYHRNYALPSGNNVFVIRPNLARVSSGFKCGIPHRPPAIRIAPVSQNPCA